MNIGQMTNEDDIEFFLFTVHLLNTNWYWKSEQEFSYKEHKFNFFFLYIIQARQTKWYKKWKFEFDQWKS